MKQQVAKASVSSTYVAYVKCVAVSEKTSPSVWCWRSSCPDWTTATRCWRAFRSQHSSHFKESRTPPHGSSATFHITNTSLPISASCTGFRFTQELNTSCAWRCTVYTTVAALRTSPTCCSRQIVHHVPRALRRLVELRQAATSDEIRRMGVVTFWSSGMESTSRAHQTTVVSLCFQARTLKNLVLT